MKKKICLVSFIYPLIEKYLEEFIHSINSQTFKEVDFIIVDDKCNKELKNYFGQIFKAPQNLSIIEVRTWIINKLIDLGYDLVIFIDADDIMLNNRIEKILEEYEKTKEEYGFYYNELYLLENINEDFYKGKLPYEICDYKEILNGNCIGMSHTAINLSLVKEKLKNFNPSKEIIAYDWLLHTYLLLNGYKGKKVDTKTYYRIYEDNIAGKVEITDKKILTGIRVKKVHYNFLKNYNENFKKKYEEILQIEKFIEEKGIEKYKEIIGKKIDKKIYWWENIISIKFS